MPPKQLALTVLVVLALANIYLDVLLSRAARRVARRRERPLATYSFLDDDRPPLFPAKGAKRAVRMSVEESAHYDLLGPHASEEWLWISTVGDGDPRLGPRQRIFGLGMTHQQHCLQYLLDALQAPHAAHGEHREHPEHCLNHIRQYVLCDADVTLEPADVLARNWTEARWAGEHRCVDWEMVRAEVRRNWVEWKEVREGRAAEMPSLALYE
ncbi:uncharacterized protein B0H18DRAFT_1041295 [Fomitopsis serialis]|uniref:uncharacterized protein n=1 Tax=Fomitopsis serialis TaxID=139415 RepID=UPI0020085A91|nr:uncharacterized protein B0H18DRAFT_1041295 [Neoantrodia serialis]KAH9915532.1 hypothetical protein B0H18DRAFT_1041295 [Neoantrodia serialis]